jgi:hypothetical protein
MIRKAPSGGDPTGGIRLPTPGVCRVTGPSFQFHLGGGAGGMQHFIEHLMPVTSSSLWKALGNPTIMPELQRTLIEGSSRRLRLARPSSSRRKNTSCWSGS